MKWLTIPLLLVSITTGDAPKQNRYLKSYCKALEAMWDKYKSNLDMLSEKQKTQGWALKDWYDNHCK